MHLYFLKSHSLICKAMNLGLILRFSRIFPRLVTISIMMNNLFLLVMVNGKNSIMYIYYLQ